MRVLLYGMQSSGASVLAYTLAQKADCVALVDVWNTFAAPELDSGDQDIIAKTVVTTAYSLGDHRRRFRPDVTLLVLRHPVDTYDSLVSKPYANENGLLEEKFALWEEVFRSGSGFDEVVYYEDFAFCPANVVRTFERIGWKMEPDVLSFGRTPGEIEARNLAVYPDLHSRVRYGMGNVKAGSVLRDRVRFSSPWGKTARLPVICPALFEHYTALREERGDAWHVPSRALLSCGVHAFLKELTGAGAIPRESERQGYRLRFTGGTPQCRITNTEVALYPAPRWGETRLTVSGLPGRPFDRIRGVVYAEHAMTMGTVMAVKVESEDGRCLAEESFRLSHSSMRQVDLKFESGSEKIALTFSVRMADTVVSETHSGVCIQELRLEQAIP